METTLVVAGNYNQYVNWCKENRININSTKYVSDVYAIRGIIISNVVYVGTYYERDDLDEIDFYIKSRHFLKKPMTTYNN